jgi:hypothetical protein
MSLFVRVHVGYWTHRKTVRLTAILGPEAVCLPIKLWCYAAQNQPDGDFSKYLPQEIAMLVGYLGDAEHMLQAMQQAGFLDSLCIHGWSEHNSYHQTFADRAKKAATARWEKQREEEEKKRKRKERKGKEASNASSMKGKLTLDELKKFAVEIGLPESDGEACFHKWEGNGWTNGGKPVVDCKGTIRNWKIQGFLPSQKKPEMNGRANGHPSPSKTRTAAEYQIEMGRLQAEADAKYADR